MLLFCFFLVLFVFFTPSEFWRDLDAVLHLSQINGILPKGPYPPCLRMADRSLLAGYHRYIHMTDQIPFSPTELAVFTKKHDLGTRYCKTLHTGVNSAITTWRDMFNHIYGCYLKYFYKKALWGVNHDQPGALWYTKPNGIATHGMYAIDKLVASMFPTQAQHRIHGNIAIFKLMANPHIKILVEYKVTKSQPGTFSLKYFYKKALWGVPA